jgi:hypothetical protein
MTNDINTLKDKLNELYTARDTMVDTPTIRAAYAQVNVELQIRETQRQLAYAVAEHNVKVLKNRREELRSLLDNDKATYNSRTAGEVLDELNRVRKALQLQEEVLHQIAYEEYQDELQQAHAEYQGELIADYDS